MSDIDNGDILTLPKNLVKELSRGEGVSVEFKEVKTNELPKSLFESICAMLNRNGGHIFLGITNSGSICGVDKRFVRKLKADFANQCNNPQKIFPTVRLDINEYVHDGKIILHAYVFEGSDAYQTAHKFFDRNEDGDFEITNSTSLIAQLYVRKGNTYTENKIYPYATMEDLRTDLIEKARILALKRNPNHIWGGLDNSMLLRSAGLYEKNLQTGEEGLNLAGILLFGKDETIKSALSYYRTDAIFRAEEDERYNDRNDIRTNLIDAADELQTFILKHTNDKFHLEGNQRLSLMAIIARELCVNMIIHREYSNPLPARLIITPEEIVSENANRPRTIGFIDLDSYNPYPKNPKIAAFFKEIGYAEELGSGIRKITKYALEYSGEVPSFEDDNKFRAVIPLVAQSSDIEFNKKIYIFIARKGQVSRKDINAEFYPKMDGLSDDEKATKIHNALTALRRQASIKNIGGRNDSLWQRVD